MCSLFSFPALCSVLNRRSIQYTVHISSSDLKTSILFSIRHEKWLNWIKTKGCMWKKTYIRRNNIKYFAFQAFKKDYFHVTLFFITYQQANLPLLPAASVFLSVYIYKICLPCNTIIPYCIAYGTGCTYFPPSVLKFLFLWLQMIQHHRTEKDCPIFILFEDEHLCRAPFFTKNESLIGVKSSFDYWGTHGEVIKSS